eukprot:gene16775-biopygen3337
MLQSDAYAHASVGRSEFECATRFCSTHSSQHSFPLSDRFVALCELAERPAVAPLLPEQITPRPLRGLARAFRTELQLEGGAPRPESLKLARVLAHASPLLEAADRCVVDVGEQHPEAAPESSVPVGDRPLLRPLQPIRWLGDAHAPLDVLLLREAGEDDDHLPGLASVTRHAVGCRDGALGSRR